MEMRRSYAALLLMAAAAAVVLVVDVSTRGDAHDAILEASEALGDTLSSVVQKRNLARFMAKQDAMLEKQARVAADDTSKSHKTHGDKHSNEDTLGMVEGDSTLYEQVQARNLRHMMEEDDKANGMSLLQMHGINDDLGLSLTRVVQQIDADKIRTEQITRELDAEKEKNEAHKKKGAVGMDSIRENLRGLKQQIVGAIEERKHFSASIEEIRSKKNEMDDRIKKQKALVGKFTSNNAIDTEIERIEEYMAHNSIPIKEEKAFMVTIKELNKKRDEVKAFEVMEGRRGGPGKAMTLPDLFDARKRVDERLEELRAEEKKQVDKLNALREKNQQKDNKFPRLLEERKEIREHISKLIADIRALRDDFQNKEDDYFKADRLVKNIKWQIRQKNLKEREERQEARAAAGEAPLEEEDEDVKQVDWDLAQRICLCEQLIVFLEKYTKGTEAKVETKSAPQVAPDVEGAVAFNKGANKGGLEDDPLGLNDLLVSEAVHKNKKKKDKKKAKNQAKAADEDTLHMSLDTVQQFAQISVAVPVNTGDCAECLKQLRSKKKYYEEKGEEGLTLKEVTKLEREARKKDKSATLVSNKASPKSSPKPSPKMQAQEEPKKATKGGFAAPTGRPGGKKKGELTDAEKKARGLLYDTSKASAVREDSDDDEDDEAADFAGGDPFDGI